MSLTLVRRYALTLGLVIALSGCVGSLLGGGKPDRLYRFGPTASAAASAPIGQPARVLAVPPPQFAPDIGGDRILTVAGQDNAYLKDMRWVSPAPTLYAGTIETTLAERAPDMIVATRAIGAQPDARLAIEIDRFEARYDDDGKAAPTIHIEGRAVLIDTRTKAIIGRYRIAAAETARSDTGAAIAAAFDTAARASTVSLVDWVNVSIPLPGVTARK